MDFVVNDFTTIKNFELIDQFETKIKFGEEYEYQRFVGKLNEEMVTGQICLEDDQIYGLTLI